MTVKELEGRKNKLYQRLSAFDLLPDYCRLVETVTKTGRLGELKQADVEAVLKLAKDHKEDILLQYMDSPDNLKKPMIRPVRHEGYAIVEWGGILG